MDMSIDELQRIRLMNRILLSLLAVSGAVATIAWRSPSPDVVKAKRFEVVDDSGKVWATLEKGRVQLSNGAGDSKVLIAADENNGNLTLSGTGKKRISIFMADQIPIVALSDTENRMIASLPKMEK